MFDKIHLETQIPGQVIRADQGTAGQGENSSAGSSRPNASLRICMLSVTATSSAKPSCSGIRQYAGSRVGEGIFVTDGDNIMMNNLLMLHLIKQCALRRDDREVRKVARDVNVRFNLCSRHAADLAALKRILERSRSQIANKAAFIKSNYFAFHQAICRGVRNNILATMLQTMRTIDLRRLQLAALCTHTSQEGRQQVALQKSSRPSLTATTVTPGCVPAPRKRHSEHEEASPSKSK